MADPSMLHLVARGLAAAGGIATIVVLYGAACELFPRRAALVAAAFLAVAFLHVRDSHFGVTDVPVTLLTVCAFRVAARIARKGVTSAPRRGGPAVRSGRVDQIQRGAHRPSRPDRDRVRRPADSTGHHHARPATVALAICLVAGFLVGTPFAVLDRPAFLADVDAQRLILSGLGHGGSIIDPAREVYGGVRGWIHQFTFSLRYGLGLPLLIAGLLRRVLARQ